MNIEDKLTTFLELLKTNDFAYVSSLWLSLSDEEKALFKRLTLFELSNEQISSIYESFCYINKILANDILGYRYKENKKYKKTNIKSQEKDLNEGKELESWERYINFKVKYLQAFRAKLQAGGFNPDLIPLLVAQELAHLNDLSLGEKSNEQL